MALSIALSYALIVLFEVGNVNILQISNVNNSDDYHFMLYLQACRFKLGKLPIKLISLDDHQSYQAPLVHLEKILLYNLGLGKLPPVRRIKAE